MSFDGPVLLMITEPRFSHRHANGIHHIKLLLWRWRVYVMIGPRDGAVGLEEEE